MKNKKANTLGFSLLVSDILLRLLVLKEGAQVVVVGNGGLEGRESALLKGKCFCNSSETVLEDGRRL